MACAQCGAPAVGGPADDGLRYCDSCWAAWSKPPGTTAPSAPVLPRAGGLPVGMAAELAKRSAAKRDSAATAGRSSAGTKARDDAGSAAAAKSGGRSSLGKAGGGRSSLGKAGGGRSSLGRAEKKRRSEAAAAANHSRLGGKLGDGLECALVSGAADGATDTINPLAPTSRNDSSNGAVAADTEKEKEGHVLTKKKKKSVFQKMVKMKESAAKPFRPGWKPRSTTLRRLKGESWGVYAKRNKWFVTWLLLALLGLGATLYLYLMPCKPNYELRSFTVTKNVTKTKNVSVTTTTFNNYTAPSELVVVVDGSGSIGTGGWPIEVEAARTFVGAYSEASRNASSLLSVGVVQFASNSKLEVPISNDTALVLEEMQAMKSTGRFLRGGTYFATGLTRAFEELAKVQYNVSAPNGTTPFRGIVFLTDGRNSDNAQSNNFEYAATDNTGVYPFCAKHGLLKGATGAQTCTVHDVSDFIKRQQVFVKGVFVGSDAEGQKNLCNASSCDLQPTAAAGCGPASASADCWTCEADCSCVPCYLRVVVLLLADCLSAFQADLVWYIAPPFAVT